MNCVQPERFGQKRSVLKNFINYQDNCRWNSIKWSYGTTNFTKNEIHHIHFSGLFTKFAGELFKRMFLTLQKNKFPIRDFF